MGRNGGRPRSGIAGDPGGADVRVNRTSARAQTPQRGGETAADTLAKILARDPACEQLPPHTFELC
jgi:hypothetical protein